MKTNLIWILALVWCIQTSVAQEKYSVTQPFNFPVKPGTEAWTKLDGNKEAACQIPEDLLQQMTTDALLKTCLAYPLKCSPYFDSDASNNSSFKNGIFNGFNGYKALAGRTDAGACVLEYYRQFSQALMTTNSFNFLDAASVNWLVFSRPELIARYTAEQKGELARLSFQNAYYLDKTKKQPNPGLAAYGLQFMILYHAVIQYNGVSFDQSKLPRASVNYISGDSEGTRDSSWYTDLLSFIAIHEATNAAAGMK